MRKIEILAPAGGRPQLEAAVRSGAQAVYLGVQGFNARQNAANFDGPGLRDAVSYCHSRDVKVYVTVNTLVTDSEMKDLAQTAGIIWESGADGVILQDLAAARVFRELYPDMPRHASTQMTVHNLAGAKALEEEGFSRVVLARELSLKEIEIIAAGTDLEIEVFVHGALCMCVSGACYLSSILGERSGNRGLCAQPCRLDFRSGDREYALSLKDLSLVPHLEELRQAGVTSLKIEGRMKRPEYVGAAVTACREALAGEYPDMDALQAVFSRSGFTDGYFTGKRNLSMFGYRRKEDVMAASPKLLKEMEGLYRKEYPGVALDFALWIRKGEPVRLEAGDGIRTVTVEGEIPQDALNRPTDKELANRSLMKTGDTPFFVRDIQLEIEPGLMVPVSELNSLRRQALEDLMEARSRCVRVKGSDLAANLDAVLTPAAAFEPKGEIELRVRAETFAQALAQSLAGEVKGAIILPIKEILNHPAAFEIWGENLIGELPPLFFPQEEPEIENILKSLKLQGLTQVQADNIGGIALGKKLGFRVHGGHGLNILNSLALEEYERLGLEDATLSFELSFPRIRQLGGSLSRGILVYGHLPLMRFRACPAQGPNGCGKCDGRPFLKDRKDIDFPLLCSGKRFTSLLNPVPLDLGDRDIPPVDFRTIYFTVENPGECKLIMERILRGEQTKGPRTGGLYFRDLK